MINPYVILALVLAWGASISGTAYWFYGAGKDAVVADQAQDEKVRQETLDAAQRGAAEAIAKIEVRHVKIVQPLEREVRENVVYRECQHSPKQLRLLNNIIVGGESPSDGELPGTGADGRPELRGDDPQARADRAAIPQVP